MKQLIFIIVTLLSILLSSVASSCTSRTGDEVLISEKDDGGAIELNTGQQLILTLNSNPTTGYSWQVLEIDEAVLRQVGSSEYTQNPAAEQVVGAGGTDTFRFEAVDSGEFKLTLGYARPWEERSDAIEFFQITIIVH